MHDFIVSYAPVLGISVAFLTCFIWRAFSQYQKFGFSGLILFSEQKKLGVLFMVTMGLFLLQGLMVEPRVSFTQSVFGLAVTAMGIALTAIGQINMGSSWRVGIEETAKPGLITTGLYQYSRNPIYSALFMIIGGYFICLPTVISAILCVFSFFGIREQVLREEVYLFKTYGDEYLSYVTKVGRFVPWFGRHL